MENLYTIGYRESGRPKYYILDTDGITPIPATLEQWAAWIPANDIRRTVAHESIGRVNISTVFLGLDHSFLEGPPEIYETMIFGGPLDQQLARCATHAEALEQHETMVERAKAARGIIARLFNF